MEERQAEAKQTTGGELALTSSSGKRAGKTIGTLAVVVLTLKPRDCFPKYVFSLL